MSNPLLELALEPFDVKVEITGQGSKLFQQLSGLTTEEAQELLSGGYFSALREAKMARTLPPGGQCKQFFSGKYKLVRIQHWLDCLKPFGPASIGDAWNVWRGPADSDGLSGDPEQDDRHLTLTALDFVDARYGARDIDEEMITGEVLLERMRKEGHIHLGGLHYQALLTDYVDNLENSVLEWLRNDRGIVFLNFLGQVLRNPGGKRYVAGLQWGGKQWISNHRCLTLGWPTDYFWTYVTV